MSGKIEPCNGGRPAGVIVLCSEHEVRSGTAGGRAQQGGRA
jgi:hypothetical protein